MVSKQVDLEFEEMRAATVKGVTYSVKELLQTRRDYSMTSDLFIKEESLKETSLATQSSGSMKICDCLN